MKKRYVKTKSKRCPKKNEVFLLVCTSRFLEGIAQVLLKTCIFWKDKKIQVRPFQTSIFETKEIKVKKHELKSKTFQTLKIAVLKIQIFAKNLSSIFEILINF